MVLPFTGCDRDVLPQPVGNLRHKGAHMLKTNLQFLFPAAGGALAVFAFLRIFPDGTAAHWEILVAGAGAATGLVLANLMLR